MRGARRRYQGSSDAAQSRGIESGGGNGVDGSAVGLAAGGQPRPRFCHQVLEPTHRAVASDMLENDQSSPGSEDPSDLAEGSGHIVDRAEHQSDMHRVETIVREGNRLADTVDDIDGNIAATSQSRSHSPHCRLWL